MSWTPNNGIYMDAYYNLVYPKGSTHLDGIDKDAMEVIDDHWGQFPPQHPLVGHIVGIAYIILWMINLFGNGSVCYIFIKVQIQEVWVSSISTRKIFSDYNVIMVK